MFEKYILIQTVLNTAPNQAKKPLALSVEANEPFTRMAWACGSRVCSPIKMSANVATLGIVYIFGTVK